jgi:hypothetical protein
MNGRHTRRCLALAALAAAFTVVAAPAQADSQVRPDDQATHGPGAVAAAAADLVRPDDRADRRLPATGVADGVATLPTKVVIVGDDKRNLPSRSGVPADFAQDNGFAYRGIVATTSGVPADFAQDNEFAYRDALPQDIGEPIQVVSTSDGFDWGDASIGAAGAFGLVLLAGGASVVARRHRRAAALP